VNTSGACNGGRLHSHSAKSRRQPLAAGEAIPGDALPADADSTLAPVDIGEFQLSDLAGAQCQPRQKQNHGSIAPLEDVAGAGVDHPLDVIRSEEPGTDESCQEAKPGIASSMPEGH